MSLARAPKFDSRDPRGKLTKLIDDQVTAQALSTLIYFTPLKHFDFLLFTILFFEVAFA